MFLGDWKQQLVVLSCHTLFFGQPLSLLGLQEESVHRPLVVAGHASLWFLGDFSGLSLLPIDHARGTMLHLAVCCP